MNVNGILEALNAQIAQHEAAIGALRRAIVLLSPTVPPAAGRNRTREGGDKPGKRGRAAGSTVTAATRAKMQEAQRARWAAKRAVAERAAAGSASAAPKSKRNLSEEGRQRIAQAMRLRHARQKELRLQSKPASI